MQQVSCRKSTPWKGAGLQRAQVPPGNWFAPPDGNRSRLFSQARNFPATSRAAPVPLPGVSVIASVTSTVFPAHRQRRLMTCMPTFMAWFLLPLLIVLGFTSPLQSQQRSIRTSVCEALAHEAQFDGKRVQVHARYSGTFEGTWLGDSESDAGGELVFPFDHQLLLRHGVDGVVNKLTRKYRIDDVIRDRAWEQFDFSRRRLYTGLTLPAVGCCDYVAADFDGILMIKRNFRVRNGFGNGWGHLGGSRFLLVLSSVSHVAPHPCAGTPSDLSSPIVKFPTQPPPDLLSPAKRPD